MEVTATDAAEAARQARATGTVGVNLEVFEVGDSVSMREVHDGVGGHLVLRTPSSKTISAKVQS